MRCKDLVNHLLGPEGENLEVEGGEESVMEFWLNQLGQRDPVQAQVPVVL